MVSLRTARVLSVVGVLKSVEGTCDQENRINHNVSLQHRLESTILISSETTPTFLSHELVETIATAFEDASSSEGGLTALFMELGLNPVILRTWATSATWGEDEYSSLVPRDLEGLQLDGGSGVMSRGDLDKGEAGNPTYLLEAALASLDEDLVEGASGGGEEGGDDFLKIESKWLNIVLVAVCTLCAGFAAGLTMGLVSIDPLEMAIKLRSGTPAERRQASRILPLVTRHHYLLVTLLLFNSLANEALPIFLDNLVPTWLAVILSVSLVLFFGEILPSAVFTGRNQLAMASGMAWLVFILMTVLAPLAWPIAWVLDRVLGIEGLKRYNRAEIGALMEVQQELSTNDIKTQPLHPDEVAIVNGVLQTAEKCVSQAMITMGKVFCLSTVDRLDSDTMADIMAAGYSRVLIYEGEDTRDIRGYLQVKKLIVLDPDDRREISSLVLRLPVVVSPHASLLELLNIFQTGKSHLALVSPSPGVTLEALKRGVRLEGAAKPVGIITLEDIIEEIIQEEIMDESDRLAAFIEQRAKDVLLRYAYQRRERKMFGRHAMLGRTPDHDKSFFRQLSTASSPSSVHSSIRDSLRGREDDTQVAVSDNERTRLVLGKAPLSTDRTTATGINSTGPGVQGNHSGQGPWARMMNAAKRTSALNNDLESVGGEGGEEGPK